MNYSKANYSKSKLIELYKQILRPRMIEEKMLILLRQGRISKWFSGIGQEAIAVGATAALDNEDYILPMHRNLGVFTTREIPLSKLFLQFQGKKEGFTKGRDRSFHFGTNEHRIVGMISHLGPQMAVGSGIALANKLRKNKEVVIAFTGEGGTSEGDFHEALNVASVWDLPVIFLIENNGYGLSTPKAEQFRCKDLADKGIGYGMESHQVDGNNILEVHKLISGLKKSIQKKPRPILVECLTFRMRGHEEASGTKYVPKKLMNTWAKKDPISNFENWLIKENIIDKTFAENLRKEIKANIENELKKAYDIEPIGEAIKEDELSNVFAINKKKPTPAKKRKTKMRFIDAISDGLSEGMTKYENSVIMGQDIAEYGGVFKITDQFLDRFGKDRVRNTPICESAIVGIACGLSIKGYKSIVEMQFADFVTCAFNQIVNNAAKLHYRWGQNVDMVLRMPCGGGVGAGPFHSQTNEAWFFHTPGLKIVYPSNPHDAKGLLLAAMEDPNPVLFFEHKGLYRSIEQEVPNGFYTEEIGKAKVLNEGEDLTIVTYGLGVNWAQEYINSNSDQSIELIDLRSLQPIDYDTIYGSVKKTNKVLLLHEDSISGGIGAEIAARITEHCFEYLDAPIKRVASLDTPIPFATALEKEYMANGRLKEGIDEVLSY